ncbi:PREDICTED: cytochrome c iso-1/iso-2-like [Eufriesea mexicana]|uniref:cytochrome c iso-1/iso-2-like n=1 Tax=Eufriesea mexicana TaxID=516756 RepID=UPI00083C0AFC|nr:PREDICTED: cytochrome c iso-1/iso-2-like [Eufriesea mexicana]
MGDRENGKTLFLRMCAMCHPITKDGGHRVGPNLFGIFGKTCGTTPGFTYTESMRKKGIVWNENTLDEYLQFPREFIPGTRMVFNGIKKVSDRKDIIAFLATLK